MNRTTLLALAALALAPAGASAATQSIDVFLHDTPSLHIAPETMVASVGDTLELKVQVPVDQSGTHDLAFPDLGVKTALLQPGNSVPVSVTLERAGTFEYYCTVPGHKAGGMVGTLVVEGAAGDADVENAAPVPPALALAAAAGAAVVLRVVRR